ITAITALDAHQLRPEIEPDDSLEMADTACLFVIPHQVRERACPCAPHRAAKEQSASAILRESAAF
ncbi:hypothetical protein, partial [Parabacteroides johnsonii]